VVNVRPPPVAHFFPNGRLGKYRLLGLLGRGGMGAVYEAEDPVLGRRVALKVMLPEVADADPRAKDRFVREARAQAQVEHDHVVPIFEVDEVAGTPFLTMPLLKGITLAAALVANSRPPLRAVLRIGRQMAEGLAAAHEAGLIHRDIKPGNVWLEDPRMRVKVLDFGLARPAAPDPAETPPNWPTTPPTPLSAALTAAGTVVGTPYYMSPEQARGDVLDHRSDLFSLGIVLYEMATGRTPFPGHSTGAVLRELAATDPPPPAAVVPDLPPAFSTLVMRMLAKDPAGRPLTTALVVDELRAIEHGLATTGPSHIPLPAAPPGPWEEIAETTQFEVAAPPRPSRVPVSVWVGLGVGILAAAGLAVALAGAFAPQGELLVDADPAWDVVVKHEGVVVRGPTRDRRFVLPPGEYAVEPSDPRPDMKVAPPRVTLGRDGREAVYVWAEKPKPPPPPPDRERETAQVLHRQVRELIVRLDTGPVWYVAPDKPLPNEGFTVKAVFFPDEDLPDDTADRVLLPAVEKLRGLESVAGPLRLTPAQLGRLAATPSRETLDALPVWLDPTADTVAALARFPKLLQVSFDASGPAAARLPVLAKLPDSVREVVLVRLPAGAALSAESRAAFRELTLPHLMVKGGEKFDQPLAEAVAQMPRLKGLNVTGTPTDTVAVAALARTAGLTELTLTGAQLTDPTLTALGGLTNLRALDIRGNNALSTDAVNRLWDALGRRCQLRWDGGAYAPRP
jgi:hypothetical protein